MTDHNPDPDHANAGQTKAARNVGGPAAQPNADPKAGPKADQQRGPTEAHPLIAVVYCTGAGHTRRLAEAIAGGIAGDAGRPAALIDVATLDADGQAPGWHTLRSAAAIVFGAPTYMGNVAAPFKAFMDATSDFWSDLPWKDRLAAGFTVGSSPAGDKLGTLNTLAIFAAQHGMIWIGQAEIGPPTRRFAPDEPVLNRDGAMLGLTATSSRDKRQLIESGDLATAHAFGQRIAGATARWGSSSVQ